MARLPKPTTIEACCNVADFRELARRRLPGPIFHYIDGAADDEVTYRRNTEAFECCDLVPNVLVGVEQVDMSASVMGRKLRPHTLRRCQAIGVGVRQGSILPVVAQGQSHLRCHFVECPAQVR